MLKIEQYKLFHNSKDFEILFRKSEKYLIDFSTDPGKFYQVTVKSAINKKTIYIYYKNNTPIGFAIFTIKGGKAFWDFDFIVEDKQYRKYVRIFRTFILMEIRKHTDKLEFMIFKKNIKSLNSMFKLPKYLKVDIKKEEKIFNNRKAFYFFFDLKQLDNFDKCDTLNEYEIRSRLHFGTFARQITGT